MPPPPPERPQPLAGPGRFRRALTALGTGLGFTLIFAGALVCSALLMVHMDLPSTRRVGRTIANLILGDTFKGKLVIGEIQRLNLHGITVQRATAVDPSGAEVAQIEGLYADTDVLGLLKSLLVGALRVDVPIVHIDYAEVLLDADDKGVLGIAETFLPKVVSPRDPNAVMPRVSLSRIELDQVWAHGTMAAGVDIDAELQRVRATVDVSRDGVVVDVTPVRIEAGAPLPQPLMGDVSFNMRVPPSKSEAEDKPPLLQAHLDGRLGELDFYLDASMEGQRVVADVGVPRITPEVVATFLPDPKTKLPLRAPASLLAHAEGDLPELSLEVLLDFADGGQLGADGKLSLAKSLLEIGFDIRRLDPRIALELADATPLDARGDVKLGFGGGLTLEANVVTQPLSMLKNPIPGVRAHVTMAGGVVRGDADVYEDGVPAKATFSVEKKVVSFEVEAAAKSLGAIRRVRLPLGGSARVKVKGTFADGALDASAVARVDKLTAPGEVALEYADVNAHLAGPVDKLVLRSARVSGGPTRAATQAWKTVEVEASGPLDGALSVSTLLDAGNNESIGAKATVLPKLAAVRAVELTIKRSTGEVHGSLKELTAGPRGILLDGLRLEGDGIGNLQGTLTVQGQELVGKLRGNNVDLAKVVKLAGLPLQVGGMANIDVDLSSSRQGERRGHVAIEMVNGEAPGITGVWARAGKGTPASAPLAAASAMLSANFDGDRVRVDGLVRVVARSNPKEKPADRCDGAIAAVRVTDGRGVLGGPLLDPATWKRAYGAVTVAAEDWNLRCLAKLVPLGVLPLDVRGRVTTRATIELAPGARLPALKSFIARTKDLEIEGPEKFAWESREMDVEVKGAFDPKSGVVDASVALLDDTPTPLVAVDAHTTIDAQALIDHPQRRAAMIQKLPLEVNLSIPKRSVSGFASLPAIVRDNLPPLAGDIEAEGGLRGTLERPRMRIKVKGSDLAHVLPPTKKPAPGAPVMMEDSPWGVSLGALIEARYDSEKLTANVQVGHEQREVVNVAADLALPIGDLRSGNVKPKGFVRAKVKSLALETIPFFADREVSGQVVGDFALEGLGEAPTIKADLALPGLKIGRDLAYDEAAIKVDVSRAKGREGQKDRASASAAFTMSSKTGGRIAAKAFSEIIWKDALVPGIDPNRPANFRLDATKFRIAALGPFLAGLLSRVDGTLDGFAGVGFTRLDDDDKAKIEVQLKLSDGTFHVPQLGQELHDADIVVKGGGGGLVRLEKLSVDGTKGRITGSGNARFKGLAFKHADATFEIKPGQELPVALEGVALGEARGKVTITADKRERDMEVVVGIPHFNLALPASTGRGVQGLDDNPDIFILQERPKEKELRPKDAPRLALTFNIGDIGLKGNLGVVNIELDVGLSGVKGAPLKVEITDKTRVSGDIALTRGRLVLLKRTFDIERGVIHMRPEDAGNPYVNASARWDSPEGAIFVEFNGLVSPFTKEKLKLSSPKLSEAEIVATLLSGGAKQQSGLGSSDVGTGTGQSIAQQLIAQQFSAQIAGNVSTNLGTNDDGTFRPGLVYNSGDKVIELSTYGASGQASAGGGTALKGQRTQITVDWRFYRNWSVRGKVDAGSDQTITGVDLLWQYRY